MSASLVNSLLKQLNTKPASGQPDDLEVTGLDFVDLVLNRFNVSYSASETSRRNIPSEGKVIIVANHPVSYLDSLALLRLVSEIRPDVQLVSMDLLTDLPQLKQSVIKVGKGSIRQQRDCLSRLIEALNQERALIVFPAIKQAGETKPGKRDKKWHHRFLKLALYSDSSILPIHIQTKIRQSPVSRTKKILRIAQQHKLHFNVGELISVSALKEKPLSLKKRSQLIRRHLFRIAKGRAGLFTTEKTINPPEPPLALKEELERSVLLGETSDGQKIYLFDSMPDSSVMREIGRLREHTFRYVGEGTGQHMDLDHYDDYYQHLVLWNEEKLDIVGSYRLAEARRVIRDHGLKGLYCQELFELGNGFEKLLPNAIELGRSFVQPKYWGKRSLDYLWYGLGAYLRQKPGIRYLYGPVSISNAYPEPAKQALIDFYKTHFGSIEKLAFARRPYIIEQSEQSLTCRGEEYNEAFKKLREYLNYFDVKVPTLYKQYTELCDPGGVVFQDFSVDPDFNNCIDGLVCIDVDKIKEKKRKRYIDA